MELLASELKCVYTRGNPKGESNYLISSDTETRRHGYQIGLETLVVHAVNYEY